MRNTKQLRLKKKKWSPFASTTVMYVLLGFILFLIFVFSQAGKMNLEAVIQDDVLDNNELSFLGQLNCEEIKAMIGTEKEVCVYIKDEHNNLISLTEKQIGAGCPGINVDGVNVCG